MLPTYTVHTVDDALCFAVHHSKEAFFQLAANIDSILNQRCQGLGPHFHKSHCFVYLIKKILKKLAILGHPFKDLFSFK